MAHLANASSDRLSDYFVDYLFDEYRGSRHVRRVASWVGLIVLGLQHLVRANWKVPRRRQLAFEYKGTTYKAKYNHSTGPRGGIDIVEVLPGRGAPEGRKMRSIRNLQDAERFYEDCARGQPWGR